jgi:hypothetical protein
VTAAVWAWPVNRATGFPEVSRKSAREGGQDDAGGNGTVHPVHFDRLSRYGRQVPRDGEVEPVPARFGTAAYDRSNPGGTGETCERDPTGRDEGGGDGADDETASGEPVGVLVS